MNFLKLSDGLASYCDGLRPVSSLSENLADWTLNHPLEEWRRTQEAIRAAARPPAESFDAINRDLLQSRLVTPAAGDALMALNHAARSCADLAREMSSPFQAWHDHAPGGWRGLSEGITRQRSALEENLSLIRQASELSTGLAYVLESRRAPWINTKAWADSVLSSWSPGAGLIETLGAALHPWKDLLGRLDSESCPPPDEFVPLYRFLLAGSWHLPADAPAGLVLDLADLHDAGAEAEIEDRLCGYFRARLGEIGNEIAASYPSHRPLIDDAFAIHHEGKFTLSIPALFIVSDMIALRLLESPFFCFKENRKQAMSRLSSPRGSVTEPSLLALFERGGLRKDTRRMLPTDATFNRHGVIHGAHAGWHTEANSLRCIALIEYLHSLTSLLASDVAALPA